jgi:hypothetical protein
MLTIVVAIVIAWIIIMLIPQVFYALALLVIAIVDRPGKPTDQPKTL